jgi:hypothetical protein
MKGAWEMSKGEVIMRAEMEAVIKRVHEDPKFRREFKKNPKDVLERELGFKFADDVKIKVHQEKLREVHIVLPASLGDDSDVVGQWGAVGGVRG